MIPSLGDFHIASWQGLGVTVAALAGLQLLISLYTAIYNLFFHPLRRYQGPFMWIALPWSKNISLIRGYSDHDIVALHEKLGPVVRIAPDTLSFTSNAAWKDIYGTGHAELPKHIQKGSGMEDRPNILTSHAHDHHRFRKAMAPAFANEAIIRQEPLIMEYVGLLMERFREIARSKDKKANITRWYSMTTFDVFDDLCFGESFNALASGNKHPWIKSMENMQPLVPLMIFPGIGGLLMMLLLSKKDRNALAHHQHRSYDLTMKRIANKNESRSDFMTLMLRDRDADHGLTDHELASSSDIIGAGSETTATALTGITYNLMHHPEAMAQVVREVREAFNSEDEITFKEVTKLQFLMACIDEGLRLFPPVPTALIRRTLPGMPMLIDGNLLPENTVVGVHRLAAYHSSRNFHDPDNFHPERWLPEALSDPKSRYYNDNREVVRPFSYGPRNCVGRNLAHNELRLILSRVFFNFDFSIAPGYEDRGVRQRSFQLWEKPRLVVNFKERETKLYSS